MSKRNKYKYERDSHIFDTLTPESAYWLGFLYGDASCTRKPRIYITLSERDSQHLYSFRNFIKGIHIPVRHYVYQEHPYSSVCLSDWSMVKAISKYGLTQRKCDRGSLHIDLLQDSVCKDFVRGLFDADGSFYYDGLHKNNLFAEITGYLPVMRSLKAILCRHKVIDDTKNITRNGSIFRIRFPKDACLKLIRFMYEGNPRYFLKRKYGLAKSYLDRLNETAQKQQSKSI